MPSLSPNHAFSCGAQRRRRIQAAILGCLALAAIDLCVSLWQLSANGFCEANPIARSIASFGPAALFGFKCLLTMTQVAILVALRSRPIGEPAAWLAFAILAIPCACWPAYLTAVDRLPSTSLRALRSAPDWVGPIAASVTKAGEAKQHLR